MLNKKDTALLAGQGIDEAKLRHQLELLAGEKKAVVLQRPCSIEDGVSFIPGEQHEQLQRVFEDYADAGKVATFIPAAGDSHALLAPVMAVNAADNETNEATLKQEAVAGSLDHIMTLNILERIEEFAFSKDLDTHLAGKGESLKELLNEKRYGDILNAMLSADGLNLGNLPRALFKFHSYGNHCRTPLEEHLIEAASLTGSDDGWAKVYLSVDQNHLGQVQKYLTDTLSEQAESEVRFSLKFSTQKPDSGSVALGADRRLLRNADGDLQTLNGGHGTLLENLANTETEVVFVKGLDNIAGDNDRSTSLKTQKIMGGYLIELQKRVRYYLDRLRKNYIDDATLKHIIDFTQSRLSLTLPAEIFRASKEEKICYLISALDRPIRVCGLVRDEIEYGGRAFWVEEADGSSRPQIIEPAEYSRQDRSQRQIWHSASYLNPICMVCAIGDGQGGNYDLNRFSDGGRTFVKERVYDGATIEVPQAPGLWNGGMANWLSVFIEIPGEMYRPVKTLQDLLRTVHRLDLTPADAASPQNKGNRELISDQH